MSKTVLSHYGRMLDDGTLKFYNEVLWSQQKLNLLRKEFVLRIEERKNRPSKDAYGYYFGGILYEAHQSEKFSHFETVEDIHENIFAPMFLRYSQLVVFGNQQWIEKKIKRLSSLSSKEMSEFIERVLAFLANEEIYVRSPEEYYQNYYKTVIKEKQNI